jgi:adenylate kinase family enzyme
MRLVVLTGASGSGKTTIADAIKTGWPGLVEVLHFDQIGVPSFEAMVSRWGSGEAWQACYDAGVDDPHRGHR